jgi:glycerol-3-phosphate O-acyltransferase / dihydroxyacetone phosphate acyltransferase
MDPENMSRSASLLTRFFGWTAGVFFHVERRGGAVPDGPLLVVANHPNSLMDGLVLFRVLDRPTRPLARAPLFEQWLLGRILRRLGGLPVYRREDLPEDMSQNQGTFDAAVAALRNGDAVQIYPEGLSHSEASLAPFRTGAARIAVQAEEESGWRLGLQILPVGLTYVRKTFFRGRVVAEVGKPIRVTNWREERQTSGREAVRSLTGAIRQGLESVTLNVDSPGERELIEVAERVYAREMGLARWRERETLGTRLPRLQLFARGAAWLRTEDPDAYRHLAGRVRAYERATGILRVGEADVPPAYQLGATLRFAALEAGMLLLKAPLAVVGLLAWLPAYLGSRPIVRRIGPAPEALSTFKLSAAGLLAILTLGGWTFLAWWLGDWKWAVAVGTILIPLGLVAIAWHERWIRVEEDVRLFLMVAFRRDKRDRLASMRKELVQEFDRLARKLAEGDREARRRARRSRARRGPNSRDRSPREGSRDSPGPEGTGTAEGG